MNWVVKAGEQGDDDVPEYLHDWKGSGPDDGTWVKDQRLAHRFSDRNHAAKMANTFPISAYCDSVRVVKLVRSPPNGDGTKEGA